MKKLLPLLCILTCAHAMKRDESFTSHTLIVPQSKVQLLIHGSSLQLIGRSSRQNKEQLKKLATELCCIIELQKKYPRSVPLFDVYVDGDNASEFEAQARKNRLVF